jgi:hypothetical protein
MSSASDRKFTLPNIVSGIHRFFAAVFGGFISFLWRNSRYVPLRIRLSIGYVALGAIAYWVMGFFPEGFISWASFDEAQIRLLQKSGEYASSLRLDLYAKITIGACILAAVFSFIKFKISYYILEAALSIWALLALAVLRFAFSAPAQMCASDYKIFDKLSRNAIWTASLGFGSVVAILFVMMLLALSLSTVRRSFSIGKEVSFGDKVVVSLISGGSDPRYRTSWYWAVGIFVFIIVAPFIFRGCGWEDPYGLVKGSGQPEVQVVKVKKIKREKKKKYILNKWSPYILERAKLDDVKTFEDMLEQTQDTYVADQPKKSGKLGKGGGKTGGWPKGMEGAKVRFIRLEYAGGDWNQDMGKGSDYNLLIKFHEWTGFKIARDTEHREIQRLKFFPKKRSPPFVFLTGMRGINLSESEVKILRDYCLKEGGMLFIDNGGGHFGSSVRQMLRRVFPGKPLVDISNDDEIFQRPYIFPDGAPPFWHHDGSRALGIRDEGRWVVFYHPGDINDAWKDGHSGATDEVADQAYKLGVNIMYYAFTQYYRRHFGDE